MRVSMVTALLGIATGLAAFVLIVMQHLIAGACLATVEFSCLVATVWIDVVAAERERKAQHDAS